MNCKKKSIAIFKQKKRKEEKKNGVRFEPFLILSSSIFGLSYQFNYLFHEMELLYYYFVFFEENSSAAVSAGTSNHRQLSPNNNGV